MCLGLPEHQACYGISSLEIPPAYFAKDHVMVQSLQVMRAWGFSATSLGGSLLLFFSVTIGTQAATVWVQFGFAKCGSNEACTVDNILTYHLFEGRLLLSMPNLLRSTLIFHFDGLPLHSRHDLCMCRYSNGACPVFSFALMRDAGFPTEHNRSQCIVLRGSLNKLFDEIASRMATSGPGFA